jgi:peptidoglycan/LPS O-acetylase OafA/YrhL
VSSSERLPLLDGLRAISILLVLAGHMLPLGPKVLQLNSSAAAMGMSLFFALSGFLIASGLLRNSDVPEFLVRRLARILPLAYAYTFLTAGILYFDPKTVLWMASFLLNFRDHLDTYNAHFWSLCVEMHFYLVIAVVVAVAGRRGVWIVWPLCFMVTAIRLGEGAYGSIPTHLRADEILAGACVATLYQRSWSDRVVFPSALVTLAALLWFVSGSPYTGWCNYLRPYATASLLAAVLSLRRAPLADFLAARSLRYIATISYALYVIHPLTVHGWWSEGSIFDRYFLKRPISFAMTFIAAHISTFYWERPWQQAARHWIEQRRARRQIQSAPRDRAVVVETKSQTVSDSL